MIKSNKGQISLEALVIFGILVVGSIIFGLFYMNNVRDILVEGPGTKQDKNGGGDIYDDFEGSLIYNEENQIDSSSVGMSLPAPYCGDTICNGSEDVVNCSVDCGVGYFITGLELELLPEGIAYTTTKITINATLESNALSMQISQINIKKYNIDTYSYYDTTDCGLIGYDNNYTYLNVGSLLPSSPGFLIGSFDFFCNSPGYYEFTFSINTGEYEISNYINKEIAEPPLEFISVWNTDLEGSGLSESNEIILPIISSGTYDFYVDWGDGITTHIINVDSRTSLYYYDYLNNEYIGPAKHTYTSPGIYTVTIIGEIDGFTFVRPDLLEGVPIDVLKLQEISQWGPLRLGNSGNYFYGAENLVITATDLLDTSDVTDMSDMFRNCRSLTEVPRINEWDTTNVIDMSNMFNSADSFNQPLDFNTTNVREMSYMFWDAENFNSSLNLDTSNVRDMSYMFSDAENFNQPLDFNTTNVINMAGMFRGASDFNQPLNDWNVSKVTNMTGMFIGASSFNQPLNAWNVSNVTNMTEMFSGADSFNQPLDAWNVSNVTNMAGMFSYAHSFNQPITNWNTIQVTNMSHMFYNANSFNQILATGECIVKNAMDYCLFDTTNVTDMSYMFSGATDFNQPLSFLEVSKVIDMSGMFSGASAFNQNISNWNVDNVLFWAGIFFECPIATDNKPPKFR